MEKSWRDWNKNIKNSLGATWNASHLAVRLCALRHWKRVSMPPTTQSHPPPSHEGSPHCPKDKNLSPFHGEKPLIVKWFLEKGEHEVSKALKKSAGGRYCRFFADYIWALPTFNNRWGVLFRCRWVGCERLVVRRWRKWLILWWFYWKKGGLFV